LATDLDRPTPVPWHLQLAVYGIGLASTTMYYLALVVVPLWLAIIETSDFLIGVVISSRFFLPLILSIHGGVLMDRLGGRRVMIFFGIIAVITPLLFPAMPWIGAALILQMLLGLADAMGWIGAQTLIGHHMRGSTKFTIRLSFTCRFGPLFAPIFIGWVWDTYGPNWVHWDVYGPILPFAVISVAGLGMLLCAVSLPKNPSMDQNSKTPMHTQLRVRDLLPRWVDYVAAFRLLFVPAIALIVMISALSHIGASTHSGFYVVYLGRTGFSGTEIGILVTVVSVAALFGALSTKWMARIFKPYWFVMAIVLAGILAIALTPAFGMFWMLAIAAATLGAANGSTQPIIISTVLRAVDQEDRGKAVGLRSTMNRVASISAPILMGTVSEFAGLELSFYFVGVLAIILMGSLVIYVKKSAELTASNKKYTDNDG